MKAVASLDTKDGLLYPKTIDTGRVGKLRPISFQDIKMDKDYIWKMTVFVNEDIGGFERHYNLSILLDPTDYNNKLASLAKEATKQQLSLGNVTERLNEEMAGVHDKYSDESVFFRPVDFKGTLLKFEEKGGGKQLICFHIAAEAVIEISKLKDLLDKAALTLSPYSIKKDPEDE